MCEHNENCICSWDCLAKTLPCDELTARYHIISQMKLDCCDFILLECMVWYMSNGPKEGIRTTIEQYFEDCYYQNDTSESLEYIAG
jgi:hypothetical protein